MKRVPMRPRTKPMKRGDKPLKNGSGWHPTRRKDVDEVASVATPRRVTAEYRYGSAQVPALFRPIEKFEYVRSPALLANVKQLMCTNCRRLAPTDPAHSNWAIHGKGKSVKASDIFIAALCRHCHTELDQGKDLSNEQRQRMWWRAHVWTVKEMLGRSLWPVHIPVPDIVNYPWS